jgi:uncharacterized membrane protein SpoIIM required for sporulation
LSGHLFSCDLWSKQVATLLQKFFFSFSGWWILWLAVSFGYSSVDDYYYDASSAHSIKDVKIPLLCIQVWTHVLSSHDLLISQYTWF